eukprot:TRINITY_DN26091_c0_g1_i1.p1 TRINITY_DN26091_c0_g1~~TRINITY_DN26091_c0_g1_i1.p1  ORF type:complete len:329 (-),score=37.23 TRINITY_DN26091_c0_g1_i1:403-1389(-)
MLARRRVLPWLAALFVCVIAVFSRRPHGFLVVGGGESDDASPDPPERTGKPTSGIPPDERNAMLEISTIGARAPFVMAFCIFFLQFSMGTLSWVGTSGADMREETRRIRDSLAAFCFIAAMETCHYFTLSVNPESCFGSRFVWVRFMEDGGPHILARNFVWLVSTPLQWYCYARSCSLATPQQVQRLCAATMLMQLFGILFILVWSSAIRLAMFLISCVFFLLMFREAHQIAATSEMRCLSLAMKWLKLLLWIGYPLAVALRLAGRLSPWMEQVLVYTALDVIAKTVTMTGILATQLTIVLARISEKTKLLGLEAGDALRNPLEQLPA